MKKLNKITMTAPEENDCKKLKIKSRAEMSLCLGIRHTLFGKQHLQSQNNVFFKEEKQSKHTYSTPDWFPGLGRLVG